MRTLDFKGFFTQVAGDNGNIHISNLRKQLVIRIQLNGDDRIFLLANFTSFKSNLTAFHWKTLHPHYSPSQSHSYLIDQSFICQGGDEKTAKIYCSIDNQTTSELRRNVLHMSVFASNAIHTGSESPVGAIDCMSVWICFALLPTKSIIGNTPYNTCNLRSACAIFFISSCELFKYVLINVDGHSMLRMSLSIATRSICSSCNSK